MDRLRLAIGYLGLGLSVGTIVIGVVLLLLAQAFPSPPPPARLHAIEESELAYPGSVEVGRYEREGEYKWLADQPTTVGVVYRSEDPPDAILGWYANELGARGWVREHDMYFASSGHPPLHSWCHPSIAADFKLTINDEGDDRERFPIDEFVVRLESEYRRRPEVC